MEKFDIWVNQGCVEPPEIDYLLPIIGETQLHQLRLKVNLNAPGFLGLDFSLDDALELKQKILLKRALGLVVPTKYRTPRLSVDQARPIAEVVIKRETARLAQGLTVYPMSYERENVLCFTFSAVVKEWAEQDLIPSRLFASIDKVDGHHWSAEHYHGFLRATGQLR